MSMELSFWEYTNHKNKNTQDHIRIYQEACCQAKSLDELKELPIDEILQEIAIFFSDWTRREDGKHFEKEEHGSFDLFTTDQTMRACCYDMSDFDMTSLINILVDFGCPFFDPQTGKRYDSWTSR